jgi:Amt family ammonium transporter
MNTLIAGSAAMLSWLVVETAKDGKPTTLGAASGVVAGLVAVTPAAGYVDTLPAMAIGAMAGAVCFFAIGLKYRLGYDDSLDVVGVHMVGGIIGGLLVGVFADPAAVPGEHFARGLTAAGGGPDLLIEQALSIVVVMAYSFVITFGLATLLKVTVGLRPDSDDEAAGLDLSQHAESAYNLGDTGALRR